MPMFPTSKAQRLFNESHLPAAEEKINLYLKGKEMLLAAGYEDIGMDHFSLPSDSLFKAWEAGRLQRNFMGYTTQNSGLLLALGVSGISDAATAFAQNEKTLSGYYYAVNEGRLPIVKGYKLNEEDVLFRKSILDISCKGNTFFNPKQNDALLKYTFPLLDIFVKDGLIDYNHKGLQLTKQGHYFIRNVCSAFDLHLQRNKPAGNNQVFSKAI